MLEPDIVLFDEPDSGRSLGEPQGRPRVKLVRVPDMLDIAIGTT